MLRIFQPLPKRLVVAVSGGVDSMAALDFLRRRHEVSVAFFHHGTTTSDIAFDFVRDYCIENAIEFSWKHMESAKPAHKSPEQHWREQRYEFLHSLPHTVVTAHHLNDCVETWIWSSLHGTGKLIAYANQNVVRPFLLTTKQQMQQWCQHKGVPWVEDASNCDTVHVRNLIRHDIMPLALRVNPGMEKTIRKKLLAVCSQL
jgi:tRNA(Ile)-lysidine synthase